MSKLTEKLLQRVEAQRVDRPEEELEAEVQAILSRIGAVALWPKMRRSVRSYAHRRQTPYHVQLKKLVRALTNGDFPSWALREPDPPKAGERG